MKKIELVLYFSENTIKWASEKAKKQGLDITTYLISKIENEVFKDTLEGSFEPIPKFKKGNKNETIKNKRNRKNGKKRYFN